MKIFKPEGGDISAYKVVSLGDLVVHKMKAWQGSLGISQYDGIVSLAYSYASLTCPLKGSHSTGLVSHYATGCLCLVLRATASLIARDSLD